MLTHSPDPPRLGAGPGTAVEQSARPQLFADHINGGWKAAVRPVTPLVAAAAALEWSSSLGWQCFATEEMSWTDGTDTFEGTQASFNFPAFGAHTITATAVDDGAVTTIPVLVRDQEVSPKLDSLVPNTYPFVGTSGDIEIILNGSGFTAAARPRVNVADQLFEPSFELLSSTQMKIWFNTSMNPEGFGAQVFVWFPDGSTTYTRDINPM